MGAKRHAAALGRAEQAPAARCASLQSRSSSIIMCIFSVSTFVLLFDLQLFCIKE
jgi:hypothetical protein